MSCIISLGLDRMLFVNDTPQFLLRLAERYQQIATHFITQEARVIMRNIFIATYSDSNPAPLCAARVLTSRPQQIAKGLILSSQNPPEPKRLPTCINLEKSYAVIL